MSDSALLLTGMDAQNPLAFLAALGLLRVLDDDARKGGHERPRLSFVDDGCPVPKLWTVLAADEIVQRVLDDAAAQAGNAAIRLAYDGDGNEVAPEDPKAIQDLKPPPELARKALDRFATAGPRVACLAAGLFSELVQDNNGNTKPTALHFTAGQQAFLAMVDELRRGITAADVREALFGPWLNTSKLPSLSWDASVARIYALRAGDPAKEKRGSVPAANWLGVIALELFPVSARNGRLETARVEGGWKDSSFTWPVWDVPLTISTVAALLRTDTAKWRPKERAAAGIVATFRSRITRSDQGGYGAFSPAEFVP
jgi:hypothetical protein